MNAAIPNNMFMFGAKEEEKGDASHTCFFLSGKKMLCQNPLHPAPTLSRLPSYLILEL